MLSFAGDRQRYCWAGKSARPAAGIGTVPVEEFHRATAEGLEAVERAPPEEPGAAVLSTVRCCILR